jgi:MoxR-like ATPase
LGNAHGFRKGIGVFMNSNEQLHLVVDEMGKAIKGKNVVIFKVVAALLSGGHILLEDIPGVGKTTLAVALSKTVSLDYRRVQFTPDVLPSDIIGFSMFNSKTNEFEYKQGSVFCNIFLADEINRTSPKTQSALLEVMEEKRATVDGITRSLPEPFVVIATENPFGSSGTQKLPESQLDRFTVCLSMGYPSHADAVAILKNDVQKPLSQLKAILTKDDVLTMRRETGEVFVHDSVYDFIVELTEKTRSCEYTAQGVSPRGSIALLNMSKAVAYMRGRDYVSPKDIKFIFADVFAHRLVLNHSGKAKYGSAQALLEDIFTSVKLPQT